MSEFEDRLKDAIDRGKRRGDAAQRQAQEAAMNEEQLKQLHSKIRLAISERIEECVRKLPQYFPGFEFETIYGDKGWGAACSRDDIRLNSGRRENLYSRLEIIVRPYSKYHLVDIASKGTIKNRELFNRHHFRKLDEAEKEEFLELVDRWVVEFAELFAANK